MSRSRWIPLALAAACYLLAIVQRPGLVFADTKIDLFADPQGFLGDVASAWSPQIQLGHVFGGQYGGYLFPMAPWFALGDALGLPAWLVHRLWLGTILFVGAWGVVRLLDALLDRARGAPHVAAAVLFVLNPYVAVYASRTSVTLLAYMALPWLLLAVHRGLRAPTSWRWPGLFALVLTCTAGGVNVGVTGWVLVGPLMFGLYERFVAGVGPGAIRPFLVRLVPVVLVANLWWLAPVLVHFRYGLDFLPYTEQPGTIWQTTSLTESLRLMGFWTSYVGQGYGGPLAPYSSHGPVFLFFWPVVIASLVVPAVALSGFAWTRRWRYGPYFLLMALAGLLIMTTGFPEGTPLRRALTFTYNHAESVQFLRTTYKAGSLLALGLAALGGVFFGVLWDRFGRAVVAVPAAVLVAVAAWPLTTGRAPEENLEVDVPAYWHATADAVDALPAGQRAMVLPGRLFAYYDWGGTTDPILPALAERPVAERMIIPFADLRAVDLQYATDALITQERVVPGQLPPLLDLMGVGAVVTANDDDRSRSGALGPVESADALDAALGPQTRGFGPMQAEPAAAGHRRNDATLPRTTFRPVATGGMVRVVPRGGATVLDGGADGVTNLAAFGGLATDRALRYAADVTPEEIRAAGEVVITDSNRRQAFVAARLKANRGRVLTASEDLSEDGAYMDPFGKGADAQTVTRLSGVRSLWSPFSPQTTQFAEHRPFAALDGDPGTAWIADRGLDTGRHWIEVKLESPRDVGELEVLPYNDSRGVVERIEVNGRSVAVKDGWNRIALDQTTDTIRIRMAKVRQPPGLTGGAGGIRELRIPGVKASETLRPPVLAERALKGSSFAGDLTYLFDRFTIDAPYRNADATGEFQTAELRDRQDPEPVLRRTVDVPLARSWSFSAVTSAAATPDDQIDRLAGTRGPRVTSSGRYEGKASVRASQALDGDRRTSWIAPYAGRPPSLTVRLDAPVTVRQLRIVFDQSVRIPRQVRVSAGGDSVSVKVQGDGRIVLPRQLRGDEVQLVVERATFAKGTPGRLRERRAVGFSELEGIRGARARNAPVASPLAGRCGDAAVTTAAGEVALRPVGTVDDLDGPLRAQACGAPVALATGTQEIAGVPGPLRVDRLRMTTAKGAAGAGEAGRVVDPGTDGERGAREDVEVAVTAPAWLVLGEGYNRGWTATCDGEDLGAPVPVQGFANGWKVEPGCTDVAFAWGPNKVLTPAYVISAIGCLLLLVVYWRRRIEPAHAPRALLPDDGPARRWPVGRAAAAGLAAALVLGFVFAIRAGVLIGPAVFVILWRGIGARTLALVGGTILAIGVPLAYVLKPGDDLGGFNTNLAVERIDAHWVGVAGVVLLGAALCRSLAAARASHPDRPRLPGRRGRLRPPVA